MTVSRIAAAVIVALISFPAQLFAQASVTAQSTGVSAIWILANLSYAGMRAQDNPSGGWRVIAFIFGFPGTLLTLIVVPEGEERAYGVDLPTRTQTPPPDHEQGYRGAI